jgi:hypothetical protein
MATLDSNWGINESQNPIPAKVTRRRAQPDTATREMSKTSPDLFELARRLYSQSRLQRRYSRSGSIF